MNAKEAREFREKVTKEAMEQQLKVIHAKIEHTIADWTNTAEGGVIPTSIRMKGTLLKATKDALIAEGYNVYESTDPFNIVTGEPGYFFQISW